VTRVLHFDHRTDLAPKGRRGDVSAAGALEYFRSRGWEVDCLVASDPERRPRAGDFREDHPGVRSVQFVAPPRAEWTFRDQLAGYLGIARSASVRQLLGDGHDLFFTSSVFTAPFLEQLPRGCKRLLDAPGPLPDAWAPGGPLDDPRRSPLAPARESFLRRVEMELYELFDGLLYPDEEARGPVEARYPGRTHRVPPMMPWEVRPEAPAPTAISRDRHTVPEGPFDLVVVASQAPPEVRGVVEFYRNVFVPHLRKHRVRLAVIGPACDALEFVDWYVTRLGDEHVDLEDGYAQAKVVVIPFLDGNGCGASIGTIQSLARGCAVVTSAAGARGLPPDPEAFLPVDMVADPEGTARVILDLLASEPLRERMRRSAGGYYRAHFGRERYVRAMDRVMSSLGIAA
jgi:glycosyltransferase involved in cell wall biosynthesis